MIFCPDIYVKNQYGREKTKIDATIISKCNYKIQIHSLANLGSEKYSTSPNASMSYVMV